MKLKKAKNVSLAIMIVGLCIMLIGSSGHSTFFVSLTTIGGILIFAGLIIQMIFWKCTSCGRHMPLRGSDGFERCPYCGEYLD